MKAFLLAAGYGTRLRPLTNTVPKCMVPIAGRPLLAWWMDLFNRYGVTDVLLNTHYLPEPVREFIAVYNRQKQGAKLLEYHEPNLLGSGGTVRENHSFIGNDSSFLICYADNLTKANLGELMSVHAQNDSLLTMGLFHASDPKSCGIATLDENGRIVEFVEKPDNPKSDLANAGIYVADSKIFSYLGNQTPLDFGKDVLPQLVGKMSGFLIKDYLLDIGTMPNYERAQKEWSP
ncbi:MAG: nucleotidyltransferase family protein [Selenomonadaceae bacterium]|nr:nucleotidyltransferase family protein [Selenomonadaceae bacterium]